nr:MAG TPA: hypothetical protein [Caudoviricetes sp.]
MVLYCCYVVCYQIKNALKVIAKPLKNSCAVYVAHSYRLFSCFAQPNHDMGRLRCLGFTLL